MGDLVEQRLRELQKAWDAHVAAVEAYNTRLKQQREAEVFPPKMGDLYERMSEATTEWHRTAQAFTADRFGDTSVAEIEKLRRERDGYQWHLRQCEQIAGKALGYPWYKDDQKNFPGATEADGVCIGEHVGDTIVAELATRATALEEQVAALQEESARKDEALKPFAHIADHLYPENGWSGTDAITLTFDDGRLAEIDLSCFWGARRALSDPRPDGGPDA